MKISRRFLCRVTVLILVLTMGNHRIQAQSHFNAWLTTCSHLIGPTGNPNALSRAINQSKGMDKKAPGFKWDILVDLGDWTASQDPPGHEEGEALQKLLKKTLGSDRGKFFTLSGNHDGEQRDWKPGEFAKKYVNPLGEQQYFDTSGFQNQQRPKTEGFTQLINYPGTRWDRYLIRTGNVVWIMLSDRNEYDHLAEKRGDFSGDFQAGRGSDLGMPKGGYPSGSVTVDTFDWWKKVLEDPQFSDDIFITAHHLLPANTTITTDDGEPGAYHGKSGSLGPKGEIGGQLYWLREYGEEGEEINQYAQTRPFLNYLQDHPGAIAAWIGGHSHIHGPDAIINGRGISVRKYGVNFLSVGALTDSHAGGTNQMSRLLSFEEGKDEAIANVYVHKSKDGTPLGWNKASARRISLGKKFQSPGSSLNMNSPVSLIDAKMIENAPESTIKPRFQWSLNKDKDYDFNNEKLIVGEDGSPYGIFIGEKPLGFTNDTPMGIGKAADLRNNNGGIQIEAPFVPELNWENLTISFWLKTTNSNPQTLVHYASKDHEEKFKIWFDGEFWIWQVNTGNSLKMVKWKSQLLTTGDKWHHIMASVGKAAGKIKMYIDGKVVGEKPWREEKLNEVTEPKLVFGNVISHQFSHLNSLKIPFDGFLDEIAIYDRMIIPKDIYPELY